MGRSAARRHLVALSLNLSRTMTDNQQSRSIDLRSTSKIVAAYVQRNHIGSDQLASLISVIHQALGQRGNPTEVAVERSPAVSVRRSITANYVICLDCGYRGQMLKRHLMTAHGLSAEQYRARWGLPPSHTITAPSYSKRRMELAKEFGHGHLAEVQR